MDRTDEILKGVRKTGSYLLSHHGESELHRCYQIRGKHICARCSGIYPGMLAALASVILFEYRISLLWVLLSGIPTIVEKYLTGVKEYAGYNIMRSSTGALLGFGYVNGAYTFLQDPFSIKILLVGLFYLVAGSGLIILTESRTQITTP